MRVASFVSAVLGVGPILLGCGTPGGAVAPALGNAALPAPRASRESRAAFDLPNGLAVVLEESHVTPTVAVQAWVRAGGAVEDPESESGLAQVVARAVVAGARGPAALLGWSTQDATVFEMLVAPPQTGAALASLGEALMRRPTDASEIERARAEVLAEHLRADGNPGMRAARAVLGASYGVALYGHPLSGAEGVVKALTRERIAAFHGRRYVARNVTLVVVGDFDARAVRDTVRAAFATVPAGAAAGAAPPLARPSAGPKVHVLADQGREARIAFSYRLPPFAEADLAAVDVLAALLARGGSQEDGEGRLTRELVRNRQLAAGVRSSVFSGRDAGVLTFVVRLAAGGADESARLVLAEALRLGREEVPGTELDSARAALEGDLVRGKATISGYARKLGFFATVAGDPDYEDRYLARLRSLEPADVRAAAAKILKVDNLSLVALVPEPAGEARPLSALSDRLARVAREAEAPGPAAPAGRVTAIQDVVRVVLPSGMRLLVLRDPAVHAVWAHALWPGGLRLEDARSNGVTSLLAATLTRGTRTRSATRVAADARLLGGSIAASAGVDDLGLAAEFLARHWEAGLELVADCLQNPAFPEAEVELAQRAQLSRARSVEDDAAEIAERLFAATLWPRHPYRWPLLGTADPISTLTRRRLVEHYRRAYGPAGLTLAVVGDVDVERVVAKVQALFAGAAVEAGPQAPALGTAPTTSPPQAASQPALVADGPAEVFRPAPKEREHVVVGYAGVSLRDSDEPAVAVLARVLGGPEGRVARETGGAVVPDVTSFSGLEGGALTFGLASAPGGLDAAVPALRAALARVTAAGVSAPELERAQREVVLARLLAREHRAATAAALARGEALGLGAGAFRGPPAGLGALTPEALARVARRLLDPSHEIVAAARPVAVAAAPASPVAKAAPPRPPTKSPQGGGRASAP